MSYWGIAANNTSWGTIYNESNVGEEIFIKVVGDANDYNKRVTDLSGTVESQDCLVENMSETLK